jgi:hypothetical protein
VGVRERSTQKAGFFACLDKQAPRQNKRGFAAGPLGKKKQKSLAPLPKIRSWDFKKAITICSVQTCHGAEHLFPLFYSPFASLYVDDLHPGHQSMGKPNNNHAIGLSLSNITGSKA